MTNKLEGSLEENVLTLLAYDEAHAFEVALQVTDQLFSTRVYRDIAAVTLGHLETFGEPPRAHLYDLLEAKLRRGDEGILLRKTLDAMRQLAAELQSDYVLKQLQHFIAKRRLTTAVEAAADALAGDKLAEAREALFDTFDDTPKNQGIWLDDADAMLGFLDKKEEDRFITGIEELDRRGICPIRKRFMLLLAPPKRGKSWFLVSVAKAGLQYRKSVLHITLENSADETAQRYVQALFSLTQENATPGKIARFVRATGSNVVRDFEATVPVKPPESLQALGKTKLMKKLKGFKNRARLRIEAFPAGILTIGMLNSLLDKLDRADNFRPDILIIDAPYLMQTDPNNKRISLGELFIKLKGLCVQRNCALVGVGQSGRASANAKVVNATDVAEDYTAIMTVDCVITYSATAAERRSGLARLLVAACRYAKDGFMIMISQNYATGQFCLDSTYMTEHIAETAEQYIVGSKGGAADADGP